MQHFGHEFGKESLLFTYGVKMYLQIQLLLSTSASHEAELKVF